VWNENIKIQDVSSRLVEDMDRNDLIVEDIVLALDEGRYPLILTERREHLEILAKLLEGKAGRLFQLHGGVRQKGRNELFEGIRACPDNARKAILATGSYIGEGFDEPRLNTLFLTMPSSFKGKIVQYAGRLHRYHKDKVDIRIYDYVDKRVSVLERMYLRRLKTYKMLGYEVKPEEVGVQMFSCVNSENVGGI
jgi:superfamily II DNA or RNA helicase